MPAPLRIGVSANFMHADPQRALFKGKTLQYVEQRLAASVWRAGGTPILLTELDDEAATVAMIDAVEGLLLSGGADVAPESYGLPSIDPQWPGDPIRDAYECRLVELARERGKPILGVCRGAQILNVALGGTLWQDIVTQVDGALLHRDWDHYDELGHAVRLQEGSWVSRLYGGATELRINSIHHQGLRDVAPGLRATAWAPDGIVEAVEAIGEGPDDEWIAGVQWHPEWLESRPGLDVRIAGADDRAAGDPIFADFLRACRARAKP